QQWFQFTSDETSIVNELSESHQHLRLFLWGAGILAGVVVLLIVLIRRERLSQQFTSGVLDAAGGLIFICGAHRPDVRFNRAFEQIAGKTLGEIRGRLIWEVLVAPADREEVLRKFAQLADCEGPQNSVSHWHAPDGKRLFSWSNTVLLNRSGRVVYII